MAPLINQAREVEDAAEQTLQDNSLLQNFRSLAGTTADQIKAIADEIGGAKQAVDADEAEMEPFAVQKTGQAEKPTRTMMSGSIKWNCSALFRKQTKLLALKNQMLTFSKNCALFWKKIAVRKSKLG